MSNQPSHISNYRYVIGILAAFIGFSTTLSYLAIGPIAPLITTDYGVANRTVGLLTGIVALVHIPFAIPTSMLVGRMNPKIPIFIGGLTGAAPLFSFMATDNFALLLGLRAVYGMSLLFVVSAIGPLFMQWFPQRELPLVNGAFALSASLGIATSASITAPLSGAFGWEVVLSAFGGISLLAACSWLLFGKAQRIHIYHQPAPLTALVKDVLKDRNTSLVGLVDAGPHAFLAASLAWLPALYHKAHGISLTAASMYTGTMSLAGLVALLLASLLASRTRRRRSFLIIPGIFAGFSGLTVLILPDSVTLYIAMATVGFTLWFYIPALLTIPMDMYPDDPQRVSLIFAMIISMTGITGAIAPPAVGAIADLTGSLIPGLAICAAMAWVLSIAGVLLPPARPVNIRPGSLTN